MYNQVLYVANILCMSVLRLNNDVFNCTADDWGKKSKALKKHTLLKCQIILQQCLCSLDSKRVHVNHFVQYATP